MYVGFTLKAAPAEGHSPNSAGKWPQIRRGTAFAALSCERMTYIFYWMIPFVSTVHTVSLESL